MKAAEKYLVWVLVLSGLLVGYAGLTNQDLLSNLFGTTLVSALNIVVGVAAVVTAYSLIAKKK